MRYLKIIAGDLVKVLSVVAAGAAIASVVMGGAYVAYKNGASEDGAIMSGMVALLAITAVVAWINSIIERARK